MATHPGRGRSALRGVGGRSFEWGNGRVGAWVHGRLLAVDQQRWSLVVPRLIPFRRSWATRRKHWPARDVAAVGGWSSLEVLTTIYQLPDVAMQRVATEAAEVA